ncbi:DUF6364 family protein [uncultured Arcticibacterium sp.]|uniref:DUF6364 family protein n=1 Tax=uncultured Arcticibacterium sp. TaxID=2173042 RepID=UPI0030F9D3AE
MSSTKLTLTIKDASIIEEAKAYSKETGRSLSNMFENYLKTVLREKEDVKDVDLPPLVKSLSGCVPIPEGKTDDDILWEALQEKFL